MDRETKPSQTPRPQPPRQPRARIPLPFEKRPFDAGSWAYEHRVGLCCMVIAYLAFGIVFVSAKIVLQQRVTYNTIYMDLTDLQAALPEEQEPEQRDERSDYRDVRNLVSDENGRNESVGERSASSGNLSEATEEFMESLDEEAAAVRGRMQASREAFERGRREEREMIARHKAQREAKDGEKPSGVKRAGLLLAARTDGRLPAHAGLPVRGRRRGHRSDHRQPQRQGNGSLAEGDHDVEQLHQRDGRHGRAQFPVQCRRLGRRPSERDHHLYLRTAIGFWQFGIFRYLCPRLKGLGNMSYNLLKGKKGLIFGALNENSIAWKVARRAVEEGAEIVLTNTAVSIRMGTINQLAEQCGTIVVPADATSVPDLERLIDRTMEHFGGKFDFILHSIGMSLNVRKGRKYDDLDYDYLAKTLDISAISFHKVIQVARKKDALNDWGSIVALTYIAAQRTLYGYNDMADAKALLESIARSFGYIYGREKHVRINTVSQSPTPTTAGSGVMGMGDLMDFADRTSPLGNATADDCAGYVLTLFSDLTRKVTMQNLYHDGGFSSMGMSRRAMKLYEKGLEVEYQDIKNKI